MIRNNRFIVQQFKYHGADFAKHYAQYNGECKLMLDKITVHQEGYCLDEKTRHEKNEQMAFPSTYKEFFARV